MICEWHVISNAINVVHERARYNADSHSCLSFTIFLFQFIIPFCFVYKTCFCCPVQTDYTPFGSTCFHLFILLYPPPKLYLIVLYALKLSNVRGSERLRSRLDIGLKLGRQVLLFPIHADTLHPVYLYCPVSITTVFFSHSPRAKLQ